MVRVCHVCPDLERKPELVANILEYLLDKPLSGLTFRKLAAALGVSTFTLVYHFGTRAEMLRDVVSAISAREAGIHENLVINPASLDAYFDGLERSWEWTLEPRNRQLQRLEFEASMMEALHPEEHTFVRALFARWQQIGYDALVSFGISEVDAEEESRLVVDTFYGVQFDLVVNGDEAKATAAFSRAVALHRHRIEELLGQSRLRLPLPVAASQDARIDTWQHRSIPRAACATSSPARRHGAKRRSAVIRDTYRAHGFDEIETPVMEDSSRLHAGLGGDNEKLAFGVLRARTRRGRPPAPPTDPLDLVDLGLRFDLTVPLARFYATHHAELPAVFRAIQLAPVWRAERPQKGRYRQFLQCDIDIIGEAGPLAEIELDHRHRGHRERARADRMAHPAQRSQDPALAPGLVGYRRRLPRPGADHPRQGGQDRRRRRRGRTGRLRRRSTQAASPARCANWRRCRGWMVRCCDCAAAVADLPAYRDLLGRSATPCPTFRWFSRPEPGPRHGLLHRRDLRNRPPRAPAAPSAAAAATTA